MIRIEIEDYGLIWSLIDTGSSMTIMPLHVIASIASSNMYRAEFEGIFGEAQLVEIHRGINLEVPGIGQFRTKVIALDLPFSTNAGESIGLLGHDVLSKGQLFIDWTARSIAIGT